MLDVAAAEEAQSGFSSWGSRTKDMAGRFPCRFCVCWARKSLILRACAGLLRDHEGRETCAKSNS